MMRPCFNVLSPSNGEVILKPTQDMVIGCYYLTLMIHQNKHRIQKWFSTENEALRAFYLKKITLHTPVLIHSPVSSWKCLVEDQKLLFPEKNRLFPELKQEFIIYKSFFVQNSFKKAYFITNIGIVIAQCQEKNHYFATDLFLETSPGRLLFNANVKNAMKE
jgi:DNA-directed RNA polymerase beta' subunit